MPIAHARVCTYQINRCLAPCCFAVDEDYAQAVNYTRDFLRGHSKQVLTALASDMERKSQQLEFEQAAVVRDQIQQLQYVQSKQGFDAGHGNLDVIGVATKAGRFCVHCMYIRGGRVLGSRAFFPKAKNSVDVADILEGFISQRYVNAIDMPGVLVVSHALDQQTGLEQALSAIHERKINITAQVRAQRAKWLDMSLTNASENLSLRLNMNKDHLKRLSDLQQQLDLAQLPEQMECFDISHHGGKQTIASCVVFSQKGPEKKMYRTFNINDVTQSDDYAAINQAVLRRYKRLKQEGQNLPDIIFIDGGKGQLSAAQQALQALELEHILLIAIAKGPTRKAGFEVLYFSDGREIQMDARSPALHWIQHIRDESHRFAQSAHTRQKRSAQKSVLESIPGIGPKRRRDLLVHFGGLQQVRNASEQELMQVDGINKKTAQLIYAKLRH